VDKNKNAFVRKQDESTNFLKTTYYDIPTYALHITVENRQDLLISFGMKLWSDFQ